MLLAEKIKSMVPIESGRVFFGLSGSDANDTQVKLMWYYHTLIGKPERKKIIARRGGYHGVTVASGSLTGLPPFQRPVRPAAAERAAHRLPALLPRAARRGVRGRVHHPSWRIPSKALIESEGPDTVAAFIAEPVMGVGGVIVPPADYYPKIQAVLDRHGIFFIDDEVICGFGRTGKAFGAEALDIRPTTMTIAKAVSRRPTCP